MIAIDNITLGYQSTVIARCTDTMELAPGNFIALLGANGSGKSTFLRAITMNNHILSGSIKLNGDDILQIDAQYKAQQIAVVLTSRDFSPYLTVLDILQLSRAPYTNFLGKLTTVDTDLINRVLQDYELADLKHKRLSTLSDGQLQRVLIARAMVQETPYIFMDEPSSHLDINHKTELLYALKKQCQDRNKCIVYATHELDLALTLSDFIITIHDSTIQKQTIDAFKQSDLLAAMFPSPLLSFVNGKAVYQFNNSTST